jgi:hypothetical protein
MCDRMLAVRPALALSWGPVFHQTIAEHFATEYLSNLTAQQRRAFVLGSIWADGLDKETTHRTPHVVRKLRQINNVTQDVYWFFVGTFCHIAADTFAHAGKSSSFIVPHGIRHSFSELVIDSVMTHQCGAVAYPMPREILSEVAALNVRVSKWFYPLYRMIVLLSKAPLYRFLSLIECDSLPHRSYLQSNHNFQQHYEAMLQSMREAFANIWEKRFNDVRIREVSTRLLHGIHGQNIRKFTSHN